MRHLLVLWLALFEGGPSSALAQEEGPPAPATRPVSRPSTGSMGPDVYLEEVSLSFRDGVLVGNLITSPHDPAVVLASSADNHLYRSDDDGHTFKEIRLPGFAGTFPGDGIQRHYPGALRAARVAAGPSLLRLRTGGDEDDGNAGIEAGEQESPSRGRLGDLLARAGRPTVGRSTIADTLRLRGGKVSAVWFPAFHPTDPRIVWVFTFDGLFASTDGGWTFTRTWVGKTPAGSATYWIAVDPEDPQHYLLSTGEGLWVSRDAGRSYLRHTGQMIGDWVIYYADFHPTEPNYVFAATDRGLLRSADRGRSWSLIYWSTHPMGQLSRNFAFDEFNPDRAFLDTSDGLWETDRLRTGGFDSWKRTGGDLFAGNFTAATTVCPKHPGHMWTMSQLKSRASFLETDPPVRGYQFIHESVDGGKTWKVLFGGHTVGEISWFGYDDNDPDLLLIFTDHVALRMRRGPRPQAAAVGWTRRPLPDPPVTAVIEAALRHTGTSVESELRYRRRARLSALLPRLEASYASFRTSGFSRLYEGLFWGLPFRNRGSDTFHQGEFRVMAYWDLGQLVMNLQGSMIGREARTIDALRTQISLEVQEAYGRLLRLRAILERTPPKDVRQRAAYLLRMEEIRAYLDRLTGGIYSNAPQALR